MTHCRLLPLDILKKEQKRSYKEIIAMDIRQGLVVGGLVLSLTACGLFGGKFGSGQDSPAENGRQDVTDDWSCESDASGEWDCYQADPDPDASTGSEVDAGAGESPVAGQPHTEEGTAVNAVVTDPAVQLEVAGTASTTADQAAYLQDNYDWQQLSSDAYVLQLAAHTNRENAQLAIAGLDAPGAEIVKTWSDDGDVFVIIAGSYRDKPSAEAAAIIYSNRNEGATYWIRSTSNFLKAL
jgi:hypothetical protein